MNKIKYIVLFVVIAGIFAFSILYYNALTRFDKEGYEFKSSNKVLCTNCRTIISLKDNYYSFYTNLQLLNNKGKVTKTLDEALSPRLLFNIDNKGIVVAYNLNSRKFIPMKEGQHQTV